MNIEKIVWNGCDSYELSNESVFTSNEEFKPFDVIEINEEDLPLVDGEPDLQNIFSVTGGKGYSFYKAI